jgi:serine/threonine-protein kinase
MTTIAHYNLLDRMGEGGLGVAYRARDTMAGRTVALRVTGDDIVRDPERLERFLQDARAAATISHPNIASLWEVGEHEGGWYLAYEFIVGTTLREQMGGRAMNTRHALEIAAQVADALAEAHARGVVHGDLRPDTIAISGKGSVKLLEFGMSRWTRGGAVRARAAAAPEALPLEASLVVGYMSPEQALGGTVDARSDLFSLGVILYEMVSGRHPFAGATPAETLMNITTRTPPSARITNSELPREVDAVLARALVKDLARRLQGAASFAAELRRALAALDARPGQPAPPGLLPLDDEDEGSQPWLTYVLVLAAIALVAWLLLR